MGVQKFVTSKGVRSDQCIRRKVWAIFFISVVLVDFLSQISQGRVVKWVCIRVFFIGCFWMHGPTPYSVKWCLRTGIPNALQCVHALNTAPVPCLFFTTYNNKFTNHLKIEFTNKKNCGKKIWTLIGPFHTLFYPIAMYLDVKSFFTITYTWAIHYVSCTYCSHLCFFNAKMSYSQVIWPCSVFHL